MLQGQTLLPTDRAASRDKRRKPRSARHGLKPYAALSGVHGIVLGAGLLGAACQRAWQRRITSLKVALTSNPHQGLAHGIGGGFTPLLLSIVQS
jgi:hypothetical protein